jgi:hypothetical protein
VIVGAKDSLSYTEVREEPIGSQAPGLSIKELTLRYIQQIGISMESKLDIYATLKC